MNRRTPPGSAAHDPGRLADLFRRWGYLQADLDPLGRLKPLAHPDLEAAEAAAPPDEAARWRGIYCGPIGAEFMHIPEPARCRFVAERLETDAPATEDRRRLLRRLAEAELFERFLHRRYVGTRRYSIEGCAALIPLLDAILDEAAAAGAEVAILGMSHRGRLNVMRHIVGIPPSAIFAGFQDIDPRSALGGGDVKYHQGATGTWRAAGGRGLHVHLVSNPSHLEAVDPVQMGRARARQERLGAQGTAKVVPILLHGDAAFAGQGIAAETLNFAAIPGFQVGGTVHLLVNNLIGYTTEPPLLHSSRHAADLARRLDLPIVHVNGQEPEAAARAGRLALQYRAAFKSDVLVDLIGYRRYGHSEVDDPTTTQPALYKKIDTLPMLWEEYAGRLGVGADERDALIEEIERDLRAELEKARAATRVPEIRRLPPHWDRYVGGRWSPDLEVATAVDADRLRALAGRLTTVPPGFRTHPKVARGLEQRRAMLEGGRGIDWATAEALAIGSLLVAGTPVRLAGQDTRRGTFNQRHAVLFDYESGDPYVPMRHLEAGQARFDILDTPLSEAAALGFEYGFSRDFPEALVCWEAQFGDFVNGAQVIVDQFVASGEDKWNLLSGVTLLLPHGYEGQGPEHSSARIERFLALAAEHNIQVCHPSASAQYFHLLRRQALRRWRKPLVVFTPKSMLRNPASFAPLARFTEGGYALVLQDDDAFTGASRVLLCAGKIAHELRAARAARDDRSVAIVRVEQYYPFPKAEVEGALARYAGAREFVWVQEEPRNMGALPFLRPRLQAILGERHLTVVARSESASPATGSARAHALEQEALLALAFARASAAPPVV